jgi:hypothetical protein
MKRFAILFIVVIIICYFQYKDIQTEINSFSILQYKNPDKDMLEKMLFEKKIAIFTHLPLHTITYLKQPIITITPTIFKKLSQKQHTDILKTLKDFFSYYYVPLNIKSDLSINYEQKTTRTKLQLQPNFRFCHCQFLGVKKLILFPPNSKENLYYSDEESDFAVDFWNQDIDQFPNLVNAKFIEILLYPGQVIFIPRNWIFCYEMLENGMSVSFYSESIFSSFLK